MLYNRFKNAYLLGEGEEVVSAGFLHTLLEEKEKEEAQRAEKRFKKRTEEVEDRCVGRKSADGGAAVEEKEEEEAQGGAESKGQKDVR